MAKALELIQQAREALRNKLGPQADKLSVSDIAKAILLQDPATLATKVSGGAWELAPHLDLLSREIVTAVTTPAGGRLLVSMPRRCGKSRLDSHWTPVWFLQVCPEKHVMLVTYGAEFSEQWGREARNTCLSIGGALNPKSAVTADSKAAGHWSTLGGGGMYSVGAFGPMMGRGAHLLIVDDPFETWEEAQSTNQRQKLWDWWESTALTGLEPGATVIVVSTRFHEDDLIGRILKGKDASRWRYIRLPALAEGEDPLGREIGAPLWPGRFPGGYFEEIRERYGASNPVWTALFQQRPSAEEGTMLKRHWWRHWSPESLRQAEPYDQVVQSWDCAFKDTDGSDYVVGQVWARKGSMFFLLDQIRAHLDFPGTKKAIQSMTQLWPKAVTKLIEESANGYAVIQTLRHEMPGIIPISTKGRSKVVRLTESQPRAYAVSGLIEGGMVYLPDKSISWVSDFIEEAASFPNGTHDDQVDALTQALQFLQPASWKRPDEALKDPDSPEERNRLIFEGHQRRFREGLAKMMEALKRQDRPDRYDYLDLPGR